MRNIRMIKKNWIKTIEWLRIDNQLPTERNKNNSLTSINFCVRLIFLSLLAQFHLIWWLWFPTRIYAIVWVFVVEFPPLILVDSSTNLLAVACNDQQFIASKIHSHLMGFLPGSPIVRITTSSTNHRMICVLFIILLLLPHHRQCVCLLFCTGSYIYIYDWGERKKIGHIFFFSSCLFACSLVHLKYICSYVWSSWKEKQKLANYRSVTELFRKKNDWCWHIRRTKSKFRRKTCVFFVSLLFSSLKIYVSSWKGKIMSDVGWKMITIAMDKWFFSLFRFFPGAAEFSFIKWFRMSEFFFDRRIWEEKLRKFKIWTCYLSSFELGSIKAWMTVKLYRCSAVCHCNFVNARDIK